MLARIKLYALGSIAAVAAACITVNIYFPAPQVRAAAEEIVEETWGAGEAGAPEDGAPPPDGGARLMRWLGTATAHAADDPDINVSTAAIRALKAAMKDRSDQLKPFLSAGNVGIANTGMLVVRSLDGVSLSDQAKIRRLVEAENRDRMALYGEIAEANDFPRDRIADIQKIFAETWIEKAEPGWPIQEPGGGWTKR